MISILNKNNKLDESRNSLNITYPRSVNIIFGNYPYIDVVNNFIINNGIYEADFRHRDYFSFPFFSAINALFVYTSNFYSAWFFDIFF